MNNHTDISPLERVAADWAQAWSARAASRVLALWDKSDPLAYYLSAQCLAPSRGTAVIGMIQRRFIGARAVSYRTERHHLRRLGADLGLAFFELSLSQISEAAPVPQMQRSRVTMLMRQKEGAWRVFHYAEAPIAPLLELQAYYEAIAAAGLDAMPKRGNGR